jgi:hypothetical protein
MLNKRQHKIKNPIRAMLLLFSFIAGVFSVLLYSSNTTADTAAVDCLNFKLESHSYLGFVDPKHYKWLHYYHNKICKKVEDGKWGRDKANKVMNNLFYRLGICRDARINPDFEKHLKKKAEMPDSVVLAYKKFCRDTYDPANKRVGVNFQRLPTQIDWLMVEIFCQLMHEDAYPSGFWDNLLEPDLPCIKKYQERTDSICQELKNGDIIFSDAVYRWEQADLEVKQRLGPETVKKMGKDLKKPFELLIDMFK